MENISFSTLQRLVLYCALAGFSSGVYAMKRSECAPVDWLGTKTTAADNFAQEKDNFGIRPTTAYRIGSSHGPTPKRHPYAKTVTTEQLQGFTTITRGSYELINVLESEALQLIPYSQHMPTLGLASKNKEKYRSHFKELLSEFDKNDHFITYCQDPECWVSYNAITRLYEHGFRNLYWYRGGIHAWREAKLPYFVVDRKSIPDDKIEFEQYCNSSPLFNAGRKARGLLTIQPGLWLRDQKAHRNREISGDGDWLMNIEVNYKKNLVVTFKNIDRTSCTKLKNSSERATIEVNGKRSLVSKKCLSDGTTVEYSDLVGRLDKRIFKLLNWGKDITFVDEESKAHVFLSKGAEFSFNVDKPAGTLEKIQYWLEIE